MAGSPFFARIKGHVLEITAAIPQGRVLCLTDLCDWLDIPPRHGAYILSQLTAEEQLTVPWHRVVPASGQVSTTRVSHHGIPQLSILAEEGITAAPSGKLDLFDDVRITIEDLNLSLPRQHRPPGRALQRTQAPQAGLAPDAGAGALRQDGWPLAQPVLQPLQHFAMTRLLFAR